jgi:ADP-ribose pyrophosphatase
LNIVIADSLVRETLSPERQFHGIPANLGAREIARLMGRGRAYGEGPLPSLIRAAAESGGRTGLVLLREVAPTDEATGTSNGVSGARGVLAEWVDPVRSVAAEASALDCAPGRIPWRTLIEAIAGVAGVEESSVADGAVDLGFLVVGCQTEKRIQAIATFLRNVLGFERVAVSPHLVGSTTAEAHYAVLRHNLPRSGVNVLLDLGEAARWVDVDPERAGLEGGAPCAIGPDEARDQMDADAQRIVQLICMHWTRAELRALAGGFSGSLLFLADGWKGEARTEPMVIKIDDFAQMRRELDGYHQVKDFFGKHVPTFGYPVRQGSLLGVGMELAAMEGRPTTLQDHFEEAGTESEVVHFLTRLEKSLDLLSGKLYGNTLERSSVAPFRSFGLHAAQQIAWLRENASIILGYSEESGRSVESVDLDQLENVARLVTRNPDAVESELCLQHGDLNLANVICDEGDNVWFIDWTHSGIHPLELDFAKLENDVKFVMSKDFDVDDLPRLHAFEEYLLSQKIPAPADELPDALKFAKWDLRFRKILAAVRLIRQRCFGLKEGDDWLVYRVALLRYAMHTLSFDQRRGRGECDETQLMYALYSCESLTLSLVADDFHLKIRAERPGSYPERQRISIDESLWLMDCEDYDPPYHVDPTVLAAARDRAEKGWADPEEADAAMLADRPARFRDDEGRPLNPRGRTGIAGRGLLGLWGANASVVGVVLRTSAVTGELQILLGSSEDDPTLEVPQGFLLPDEEPEDGLLRVMEVETGWRPQGAPIPLSEGYAYDARQTDHAWVEQRAYMFDPAEEDVPDLFDPGGDLEEVSWWPMDVETMTRIPAGQAPVINEALEAARGAGRLDEELAERLIRRAV